MSRLSGLLEEWEEQWRVRGVPVDAFFRRGAPPEQVRARLEEARLPACPEIVDWFAWHDGATVLSGAHEAAPLGFLPISLDQALRECDNRTESAHLVAATAGPMSDDPSVGDPLTYWGTGWLPLADSGVGGLLVAELITEHQGCPIRSVYWDNPEFRTVRTASITNLVTHCIDWLALDLWTWSTDRRQWSVDFRAIPHEVLAYQLC